MVPVSAPRYNLRDHRIVVNRDFNPLFNTGVYPHSRTRGGAMPDEQTRIWKEMLAIHADQQFIIGVISSVRQPVVVSKRLRNVPEDATYSWEPGALFGIYRPDQFWFAS